MGSGIGDQFSCTIQLHNKNLIRQLAADRLEPHSNEDSQDTTSFRAKCTVEACFAAPEVRAEIEQ